jgi:hypothetical protein
VRYPRGFTGFWLGFGVFPGCFVGNFGAPPRRRRRSGSGLGLCHTVMSQGTLCLQVVMRGLEKLGQPQQVSMNLFIYIHFLQFAKIYNLY